MLGPSLSKTESGSLHHHRASHAGVASTQGLHSRFPPLIGLLLLGFALLNALNLLAGLGFRVKGLTPLHLDIVSVQMMDTVSVQLKKHSHPQHAGSGTLCYGRLPRACCCRAIAMLSTAMLSSPDGMLHTLC